MDERTVCLVTIHGIGFQQPPLDDVPGYADSLHARLGQYLGTPFLGSDPAGPQTQNSRPIYVQSSATPDPGAVGTGLDRLGTWQQSRMRAIDTAAAPLVKAGTAIAHIALVYSRLEDEGPRHGSGVDAAVRAGLALSHYATVRGLVTTVFSDVAGAVHSRTATQPTADSSLRTRMDALSSAPQPLSRFLPHGVAQSAASPTGLLTTLHTLENDVAAYVCRNELRERVRSFVRDALHRLCYREDVGAVVVNAHSNGTVIAFDVLRDLTPIAAQKVRWFITAGSPLRKYADLFYWGTEVGSMSAMGEPRGWTNFWDPHDPVADPLSPPPQWLRGTDVIHSGPPTSLFQQQSEEGASIPFGVTDAQVDNLSYSSGGGLQAHNYWDNDLEVIAPVAALLRAVVDNDSVNASGAHAE